MKTLIFLLCFVSVASAQNQSLDANADATTIATNPISQTIVGYQQGTQAANQNVWQKIVQITDNQGNVAYQTNDAYTQLETGLNHLVNNQWIPSKEEIDISADGNSALATNGQHQAYFPGDIYSGQIELVTPDGKQLYSRPVGLSYDDGTNTVLIAALTNSTGEVVSNNQVIYANAFTDFKADIRYTYTKAGFEQDIILREQPPTPASFGLNPDTTTLQVLTEFFNPPQPTVTANTIPTDAGNLEDDFLDFGVMQMVPGKAFLLGTTTPSVGVNKQWLLLNGRQILVEEVPVVSIGDELDNLPLPQVTSIRPNAPLNVVSTKRLLPAQRMATVPNKHPMQLARATPSSSGLVLDYVTMTSQTNYTFRGDTTYYISGAVNLYQTNTFEGGAVLKYTNNASVNLESGTVLNWNAAANRPVIFTAKDDNSVGDSISGSTGSPTNYYANPALNFNSGAPTYSVSNFRIAWASQAISVGTFTTTSLYHGQLVNCLNGITFSYGTMNVRNLLFANVQTNFNNLYANNFSVQNSTFSGSACMIQGPDYDSPVFTNCILVNVTSLTNGAVSSFSGDHNGFYNSTSFGTNTKTNTFYPFKTAGAGNYYLTNGCAFTNAGTASIDPTLLSNLQQKTIYPPLFLTNQTLSVNTNFNPQAQRDTNSSPALGYHYDPIDYIADLYTVTNATLTLSNGVAIASYNEAGIQLQRGSKMVSIGSPLYPNWFVRYSSVQEQSLSLKGTNSGGIDVMPNYTSVMPNAQYQFTKFACPAGGGIHLYDYNTSSLSNLTVQECEFWGGTNVLGGTNSAVMTLNNNLFARSVINATGSGALSFTNNLVWGASWAQLNPTGTNKWYAYNNDFDSSMITNSTLTNGYNAYLNCSGYLNPTNTADIFSANTLAYQTSWLGTFYQPASSLLIDMGSTNASALGLYHYTTQTNQVPETNSTVDIGYHYVATDNNGNPLDSNGDGIPDYLEDANGDGIVNNGETNWGLAILIQPVSQTVVQNTNVTFSVTAQGVSPLIFQWYFNGTILSGATNTSITISNVQPANVGSYQLVVTNFTGSLTSSVATLTLTCDGPPSGLVGWWQAESNALDSAGADNGIVTNGISYTAGKIGTAFNFDGTNGFIQTLDAPDLDPTNLTIEAWVRFSSLNSKTNGGAPPGEQFIVEKPNVQTGTYQSAYILYKWRNGSVDNFEFEVDSTNGTPVYVTSSVSIQTNVWYHVAGVRGSNYVQLFVNGQPSSRSTVSFAQNYGNEPLNFGSSGEANIWDGKFEGSLDEVSLYNRALSTNEIVALYAAGTNGFGKCLLPPTILTQPASQTAIVGETATLMVVATGTQPLSYQWYLNGTSPIAGGTNAILLMPNAQSTNTGNYSVTVSNSEGMVTSSNALVVETCASYLDVAMVMDRSGSMSNKLSDNTIKLTAVRIAATNFVQSLNFSNDQASVFSFNDTVTTNQTLTNNLSAILHGIGTITNASGQTYMGSALQSAQAELTGVRHRSYGLPVMVFLSDGDPNDIANNFVATSNLVFNAATQVKAAGTRLITIAVGTDADTNFMRLMATSTNDFYYATNSAQLTNAYNLIASSICRGGYGPTVNITSPTNGQFFVYSPTNIILSASASESGATISNVSFYQGTSLLGSATAPDTNGLYDFVWQDVSPGVYSNITAQATDNHSVSAISTAISITLNAVPIVAIVTPTNLQSYLEVTNVTLTAGAYDPDGSITNVAFYNDGTNLPFVVTQSGTNYSLTWSNLAVGAYPITAIATDNHGASTVSSIKIFRVNSTNTPPTVVIISPTNNEVFADGSDITITAVVTNGSGVTTNVEFFSNGNDLGGDQSTNNPYGLTQCCWKTGTYQLMALASDTLGASSISEPVTITISQESPEGTGFWDQNYPRAWPGGQYGEYERIRGVAVTSDGSIYLGNQSGGPVWMIDTNLNFSYIDDFDESDYWTEFETLATDTTGTNVYAGVDGNSTVIKITGTNWVEVGNAFENAVSQYVNAFAFMGGDVYVGGDFINTNVQFVAKLDKVNNIWVPVGAPLNGEVQAMAVLNGKLIVGGAFTNASGNPNTSYIAQLEGTNWIALGTGITGIPTNLDTPQYSPVNALAVCGSNLFVGGSFSTAGDQTNANGLAVWNGSEWQTISGGVGLTMAAFTGDDSPQYHLVTSLAAHGNRLFVGGLFTNVFEGTQSILALGVAAATWNEAEQTWAWSDLDQGVGQIYEDGYGTYWDSIVTSLAIREGAQASQYDLLVNGNFDGGVGDLHIQSCYHWGLWRVGYPQPPSAPTVTVVSPPNYLVFTNNPSSPITITNLATATSGYTNIDYLDFLIDGIGQGEITATNASGFYEDDWYNPAIGVHLIKAVATDGAGLVGQSTPIAIIVKSPTNSISAANDFYTIPENSPAVKLYVLTNDLPTSGLKISQVTQVQYNFGQAAIGGNGTYLTYTPLPNTYGTEILYYSVTNGSGAVDSAAVTVGILAPPQVQINSPDDGQQIPAPVSPLIITGTASAWGSTATITNVTLDIISATNIQSLSQTPAGGGFSFNWTNGTPGFYTFVAVATDSNGSTNVSVPATITLYNSNAPSHTITAIISNLNPTSGSQNGLSVDVDATITNGLFDLQGTAADSVSTNPVAYQVLLYQPITNADALDGNPADVYVNATPFANVTPGPLNDQGFHNGSVVDGDLGTLNLTGIPNGIYELMLLVRGGTDETNTLVEFQLDSQLKIGQFSFSEQDLVLPVNGIPITVTRTYNSMNPLSADFGYSWTYSLNSMDVQLDDQRQDVTIGSDNAPFADDDTSDNGLPSVISVRTGGDRNVTLTLPNGQRATFAFTPSIGGLQATAQWKAPPGVNATLTPLIPGSDTIEYFPSLYWQDGGENSTYDDYDFPGWILTTEPDGTEYYITRGSPNNVDYDPNGDGGFISATVYGPPTLTKIVQHSGETIYINDNSIYHQTTNGTINRAIYFDRDAQNRITAIYDPNGGTNALPALQYIYDQDNGNLIQVLKLEDRNAGTYTTNKYDYNNASFPHYITSIENGDGTTVAENFYDDSGRLTAVQDADGNLTQFIHNTTNNTEVVIDRLSNTNTYVYDLNGNVLAQTNALNQVTTMAYDGNNNKTNEITYLNSQSYATNNYNYSSYNELLSSTDPLGHTNGFAYDGNGDVLTSTDARGQTTTNAYDGSGNLTNTSDALGDTTINFYNPANLLVGSKDAVGTLTTNYYDSYENLIGTATYVGSTILSSNNFAYDLNGNRTNSTVWRRVSGSWTPATTTYIYDAMNRVTQTIDPDGGTNTVVYDPTGKQQSTIDSLGHTTSYTYDAQGRLIQTTYPDTTTETSAYDANGNRTNSADRLGRMTTYVYDALNRLTQTIYPDNTTNTTVYDGVGRVAQTIDARGVTNAFAYDVAGRRLAVTNALGSAVQNISSYSYDNNGNQLTFTDANNHTTTNVFDALNRQVQVQYPDGTKTSTGYDADGRSVAETNQDSLPTLFGYDGAGRLISVTNALSKITSYQYDEAGNEIAQIDALGRTNSFVYDGMSRRTAHMMPTNALVERFSYDLAGNMIYDTNFNGVIITNQYDALNRLTNQISTNGYHVSYTYTPTGQRATMNDTSGMTSYSYDNRDRLLLKAVAWSNGPTVLLNDSYDANGNVTNLWSSTANGVTNNYQYDALNRLTNVKANGSAAASYTFDNAGNLQAMQYGNGVTNLYQYDSLNRLTNLTWKLTTTTLGSFYYQLGSSGNRTNLSEKVGIGATTRTYAWQYDNLYRLTNENISALGNLGYGYDSVGNRTNRTSSISGLTGQTPTYNTNDWLTSDTYDNNGNTTSSGANTYQYDVMNHITNVNSGTILMTYDGDGNRASKTVSGTTTYYLLDDRNPSGYVQVLEEYQGSSLSKVYNYGLDLISQRVPGTSTNYFIYDGHGSTRILTDNAGSVANVFAYDAYGTLIVSNSAPQTAYLYCGQQFDFDLGLYLNRARYLNTGTGRFLSSDSTDGNNEDPLSLHKYLYAQDNPVDGTDPSGHDDLDSMSMAVYSSVFQSSLNILESVGVVSATTAPYPVVVVTLPDGTQYAPETKVKDDAQRIIVGKPRGTPIRIAVPPTVNPQALVDSWSGTIFNNNVGFFWFWRPSQSNPNNYKIKNAIWDAFGNFEFGATGYAAGFDLSTLQLAGDVGHPNVFHPNKWFENDPINMADIKSGWKAILHGGKLSVKEESLIP